MRRARLRAAQAALLVLAVVTLLGPATAEARTPAAAAGGATLRTGAAKFAQGRLAEAEAEFALEAGRNPRSPHAWLWLGVARFHRGEFAGAEGALGRAARLSPRDPVVHLWWGHALARAGRTREAAAIFHLVMLMPAPAGVHDLAGRASRAIGTLPEAAPAPSPSPGAGRPASPSWVLEPGSYRTLARFHNPRLTHEEADLIGRSLLGYSKHFNIDPRLVVALVVVESGFQPAARSRAGALGLGQLMPGTARALGVDALDPSQNLYGSIRYLRGNLDRFGWHNLHLALAAYNAGRGAVERYNGIPPYAETEWYVANVSSLYRRLLSMAGAAN